MRKTISSWLLVIGGCVFGVLMANIICAMDREYIVVRLLEYSKCIPRQYSIITPENTVVITGNQIKDETQMMAAQVDVKVKILSIPDNNNKVSYHVKAEYTDCPALISNKRTVEPGYILYETIRDGSISFQIRSK